MARDMGTAHSFVLPTVGSGLAALTPLTLFLTPLRILGACRRRRGSPRTPECGSESLA
jgi:hypothetical protein